MRNQSALALLALAVLLGLGAGSGSDNPEEPRFETVAPTLGDFVKTVPASGEIRPYRPSVVFSDVRAWPRYVIDMVPQGTWVEKGDVVLVLDASEFQERLSEPILALIADNARLMKARSDEVIQKYRNARRTMNSQYSSHLADNTLRAYEQGEYPTQTGRLAGAVRSKEQIYQQALDDLAEAQRLASLGIVGSANLMAAQRRMQTSEIELELAEGEVGLYEHFQYPRQMAQLSAASDNAREELDRTALRNALESSIAETWTLSFTKYRAGWQEYVDYLTRCVEKCTLRAPRSGQVVYLNEDDKTIEIGKTVHYMQKVFTIADRDQLSVAARVSDRHYYGLRRGQPVSVHLPSLPNRLFPGRITWLGPIPTRLSRFAPESLHHKIEILLDERGEAVSDVFPGMTAEADIIVDARENVLRVASDAIIEHEGAYIVLAETAAGPERREIRVGVSNDEVTEVLDGLSLEDRVIVDSAETLRDLADGLK